MYVGTQNQPFDLGKNHALKEIYIGMDLHRDTIQVAVRDENGHVILDKNMPNTTQDIDEFFSNIPKNAHMVMEASSVSTPVFLHLRRSGYDPVLSNPYKTKAIATSRIKTDKIDARVLAEMLRGNFIPRCYVPSEDILNSRSLIRHRKYLADQIRTYRRKIRSILMEYGIRIKGASFSKQYIERLRNINEYRINDYLDIIDIINERISGLDDIILQTIQRWSDDSAKCLLTVPGIGPYTALLVLSEIGDISRFPDPDSLVSYAGMAPSTYSSGTTTYHGHITKRGSQHLRTAMVASVHTHRRGDPNGQVSAFYDRVAAKHGNAKAMVAAGAKILRIIFQILKEQREYRKDMPVRGE